MVYVPGTGETDHKKQNQSLQAINAAQVTAQTSIDTNTAAIATINTTLGSGIVNSIAGNNGAFTLNATSGITNATNDIKLSQATASQFGAVKVDGTSITASSGVISARAASQITNSLSGDVAVNNVSNYFDGPSIAQGTTGTWFVSGTVTVVNTASSSQIDCKLWDGTTVIASASGVTTAANSALPISLSGYLASPAANLRISCRDAVRTTSKILFNQSGNSKDSTISAYRIA